MKIVLQTEAAECGLACLAMVAGHFGHLTDLAELRRRFSISLKGATLTQLMRHASAMDLTSRAVRLELDELEKLSTPCILHWKLNHFVVLSKVAKDFRGRTKLVLFDPSLGMRTITLDEASPAFTGVALELEPNPSFVQVDEQRTLNLRDLTGKVVGLRRAIFQIILLALALELFAITMPLFNQYVIDEVIVSGDREQLKVLVFGFALVLITQHAIALARSWFLMRWSTEISLQWSTRIFSHLIRLPVAYFQKRHLGDVVSRFGSTNAIQSTLTSVFVESLLDGLMALLSFAMMMMYSLTLSLLVVVAVALYGILRWVFYAPLREASHERLILSAKESSHFLETIRAITPLKLFGKESERLSRWRNLKVDVQNRDILTQKLMIIFNLSRTMIFSSLTLGIFFMGAGQVMNNALTIGMLMAFSSYSTTFSGRIANLIDMFINVRMLGMHSERLADIVLEKAEEDTPIEVDLSRLTGKITIRNLKFRFADGEPWILDGINLVIPAGQSVVFVGPSGCGKTTLCRVILGLLKPTEGEILVDDIPIAQLGLRAYRELISSVMQDDVLLAGSIMENIAFFDTNADSDKVERSAQISAVHRDICAMPMGYQTLVGDMGSVLSGGQKQRVLLARALYKDPKILVLDEATSHLDVDNEKLVSNALSSLALTRIMVAHRPETIFSAQRVISLDSGRASEVKAAAL